MNLRPPGYEPDELPTALLRDISFLQFSERSRNTVVTLRVMSPTSCQLLYSAIFTFRLVPVTGLEPVRYCYREILSLLCLPFHHTGGYRQGVEYHICHDLSTPAREKVLDKKARCGKELPDTFFAALPRKKQAPALRRVLVENGEKTFNAWRTEAHAGRP